MLKVDRRQLERRPLSGCPAQQGKGTDIDTADFILVVDDCVTGPDGRMTITEVFGYFRLPGDVHDDDTLQTAVVDVPAGSSIAKIAHQVSADPDGKIPQQAGTILRSNVARCPCTDRDECPALNEIRLLEAIEQAIALEGHALRATLSG